MRKNILFGLAILLLFLQSCVETPEYSNQASNPYGIEMNEGEKWTVDSAMAVYIKRMDAILDTQKTSGEVIDPSLGDQIMSEINQLTSDCTMTGKAHDELHKWLLPFIELTAELQNATSNQQRVQKLKALQEAMDVYHQYFH